MKLDVLVVGAWGIHGGIPQVTRQICCLLSDRGAEYDARNMLHLSFGRLPRIRSALAIGGVNDLWVFEGVLQTLKNKTDFLCCYSVLEGPVPRRILEFLNMFDHIIAPSKLCVDIISQVHPDVELVPHGIDTTMFKPLKAPEYDIAFALPQSAPLMYHRKGLDIAQKALKLLIKDGYTVVVNRYAEKAPHTEVLDIPHYCDMPSFYNSAKIFFLPSRSEGVGLQALEAMACGRPVVFNDVPAVNEFAVGMPIRTRFVGFRRFLLRGGAHYYVYEPLSIGEVILSIKKILASNVLYEFLARRAREKALEFDYRRVYKRIMELLGV